jgi:8-oxo-dGTP pyrophosphatase MutT (NUDIX family)
VNLSTAKRSLERAQRRAASRVHHDSLASFGPVGGVEAAREETEHSVLDVGVGADGGFSGASVFVVCQHGALMGCAGGIWQDFGGRRDGDETPYECAFRELKEEIGLTASHVDVLPDQPVWVVHAGYRHAVFVATLSEANRLRPDWDLGDEETPELDTYRNNFRDFANFFADDMIGDEFVHRRMKTREIFDLASDAYCDMRRVAHRAKNKADAAASSDSDDDDDDDDSPPAPPQRQLAFTATSSVGQLGDGAGRPSAASSVATPTHGRPPDTAAAAADAAAALVSASARVPRAVAEHEQTSTALTSYHSGNESVSSLRRSLKRGRNFHGTSVKSSVQTVEPPVIVHGRGTFAQRE